MRVLTAKAGSALASLALAFAVAVPAAAQEPAPPGPQAPDEAELTTYAEAFIDVQEIQTAAEAQLAAAQTEEEKAQIQAQVDEQVNAALQNRGMDRARYDEITALLEADPELKAQFDAIHARVLEARKGGG